MAPKMPPAADVPAPKPIAEVPAPEAAQKPTPAPERPPGLSEPDRLLEDRELRLQIAATLLGGGRLPETQTARAALSRSALAMADELVRASA